MRVISLKRLREFWSVYPDAELPLRAWYKVVEGARWNSLADARKVYPHADGVTTRSGTLTVFNICGNKYRLITRIRYDYHVVNIRVVLTPGQYDKGGWKDERHE